jgi:hypothetical protein
VNLCSSVRMRCSFATSRNTSELRKLLRVLRIALIGRQFEHRSQSGNYRGIQRHNGKCKVGLDEKRSQISLETANRSREWRNIEIHESLISTPCDSLRLVMTSRPGSCDFHDWAEAGKRGTLGRFSVLMSDVGSNPFLMSALACWHESKARGGLAFAVAVV